MRRNEYSSSVYRQENVKELLLQQPLTSGQFTGQKHPFFAKVHLHYNHFSLERLEILVPHNHRFA